MKRSFIAFVDFVCLAIVVGNYWLYSEVMMARRSSLHPYAKWTKKHIDEMDAALGALEANADRLKSDFTTKSDRMLADLKKQRDRFASVLGKQAKANGKGIAGAKAKLDAQWKGFDAEVKRYFKAVENRFAPRQTTFQKVAAAQAKAWRRAAGALHRR